MIPPFSPPPPSRPFHRPFPSALCLSGTWCVPNTDTPFYVCPTSRFIRYIVSHQFIIAELRRLTWQGGKEGEGEGKIDTAKSFVVTEVEVFVSFEVSKVSVYTCTCRDIVECLDSCTSWCFDFHWSHSEVTFSRFVARVSKESPRPGLDGHYSWLRLCDFGNHRK